MTSAVNLVLMSALGLVSAGQRASVFSFNSAQVSSLSRAYSVQPASKSSLAHPSSMGTEQVTVIGNFGGSFSVSGIGSAGSTRSDELINITTNHALTFVASSFTTLFSGGSSASSAGRITYEMQLYSGTASSVGAALTGPVSATDNSFNGAMLTLGLGSIPSGGQVVLRLSRTLYLTQVALGGTTYTASGTINLTIN